MPVSERESPKANIAGISQFAKTLGTPIHKIFISIANISTSTLFEFFILEPNEGDKTKRIESSSIYTLY